MAAALYETCACCGLVQALPEVPSGHEACCARCDHALPELGHVHGAASAPVADHTPTLAAALAAVVLYPFAVGLPIMEIERFGARSEASVLSGGIGLLEDGQLLVGAVVLLCSVLLPVGKLVSLIVLSAFGGRLTRRRRLVTWRVIELTGRWGMLDVLLIAVLVAVVKLKDLVTVSPGPAALAFTGVVLLSLLASAWFDPHAFWRAAPVVPLVEDRA